MNPNNQIGYQAFAGIGSRKTPDPILSIIQSLTRALISVPLSYTLRTGGAKGADQAFIQGAYLTVTAYPHPEIYLPSYTYERKALAHVFSSPRFKFISNSNKDATTIASRFHPAWDSLPSFTKPLHARNTHIILGPDPIQNPNPVQFVVCWTPGGMVIGGTGQALRIAKHYQIPVLNLGEKEHLEHANEIISAFDLGILNQACLNSIIDSIREAGEEN